MTRRQPLSFDGGWFEVISMLKMATAGALGWVIAADVAPQYVGVAAIVVVLLIVLAGATQYRHAHACYKKCWDTMTQINDTTLRS